MDKDKNKKQINDIKREKLKNCIKTLSKEMSKENYQELFSDFKKIYDDGFRHFYSDISILLLNSDISYSLEPLKNDTRKDNFNNGINLDLLAENMRNFYEYAEEKDFVHLDQLNKLNDHITMDIARINYWKKLNDSYSLSFKGLSDQLSTSKDLLENTNNESKEVKKDLVSIMGIFLGIFLFFQLNFSQIKDLLEYDPFSRIIYLIIFNIVFLVGLYLIFVIIDFLIHREPRLLKLFIDTEKKLPNKLGGLCIVFYIGILGTCGWFLYSDDSRKTISKIENSIEETNESLNHEIKKKNVEINILKEKITELENQIKEINKNNTKLEENTKIKQD